MEKGLEELRADAEDNCAEEKCNFNKETAGSFNGPVEGYLALSLVKCIMGE